ncbi:MAG: glycoside hydrolase family 3 C-terminal domain-containing protein [Bacilli bacterium]|nr:glycoside hydrolase family 3 C-terminal domain-containing protein [Bacilli bacterium]
MKKNKRLWNGLLYVSTFFAATSISVGMLMEKFSLTLDSALGTQSKVLNSNGKDGYKAFTPPEDTLNKNGTGNARALIKRAIDMDRKIAQEGTVLLKNEGNSLPLASGKKVTLFGIRSHTPILGAQMGNPIYGGVIDLENALGKENRTHFEKTKYSTGWSKDADNFDFDGGNLEINPTMVNVYEKVKSSRTTGTKVTYCEGMTSPYLPTEATLSELSNADANYKASFSSYNDAAIVVVGRAGTEGVDYFPGEKGCGMMTGATDPLGLTTVERDTIKLATDNFDNVIVIVNSSNQMEIDELKRDPKIKSILYVGFPGAYGCLGISDVITGKVSPSGGCSDVFAAANRSAPAAVNFDEYTYSNASSIARASKSSHYVMENEGIYVGYRYYETRYEDAVLNNGNARSLKGAVASKGETWSYDDEVSYPFGYGLSYTTFEEEIAEQPTVTFDSTNHLASMDVKVKVKNTGTVDSRAKIEIYGDPYNDNTEMETSALQLVAFEKTPVIKGGETKEFTVKVDLQNLTVWDQEHGGWTFCSTGTRFALGNGSHEAMNNMLALDGKDPSVDLFMDGVGNAKAACNVTFDGMTNDFFKISENGTETENQIPYSDWNSYEPGKITHLSRKDWDATWPVEMKNLTAPESMLNDLEGKYYTVKTNETTTVTWGSKETEHKYYDLFGVPYDDPRWDELASQMTLEEGMYFALFGGPVFPAVKSVGFEEAYLLENSGNGVSLQLNASKDTNAPWSIKSSDPYALWHGQILPSAPLIAATFSHEVMEEVGEFIGIESLFAGISIVWGTGLNTHRTPYCGRNNEYYSEDPVLSGEAAADADYGAKKYGLILAMKHFAFNDMETNRKGVSPFMLEQRAREIELRAYQIAVESHRHDVFEDGIKVKDAGITGIMISFSKIGGVECSCSRGMLTNILRKEWGFHGYLVTDIQDDMDLASQELYAGITGIDIRGAQDFYTSTTPANKLGQQVDGTVLNASAYEHDQVMQETIRESNKGLLWAFAQSNLVNRSGSSWVWNFTWWRGAYFSSIGVFGLATIGFGVLTFLSVLKKEEIQ